MKSPALLTVALLPAAALCIGLLPADERTLEVALAGETVVVPMDHSGRHVAVEVMIDGQGPFPFQVDTYASIDACIDDDLARELGLRTTDTVLNSDGHTTRERDVVAIDELRLGGATFTNLRTLVDDYDYLRDPKGRTVRGLLGFSLFRELLLTIDYPRSRLVLERGHLDAEDTHVMAFETPRGAPDVRLRVGDQALSVGIDSGAGASLALELADAERVTIDGELARTGTSRTVYTEYAVYSATLAAPLELAGHHIDGVVASFGEGQRGRLLGYGVLRPFQVTFDQQQRLVRFLEARDPKTAGSSEAVPGHVPETPQDN